MSKQNHKQQTQRTKNTKGKPSAQNHKKESWRGTAIPSQVDKYVDCDETKGWC
ncbi:hypothetical protein [Pontibacillus marinus]|uniref:Uncharacterized protein n=1 Tax=Pontibacillus marinus BH030004 = DSM 16465 TaxID=1385511 RepID=A0A0A5GF17_9BACI|nr:hypothetical protein [Pontibacillus marinus]KGX89813.1 hypothetical protein N783_03985 [Pontibacillus marinus BH030004 = DSM 16465]